ncbi:MAG: hypothetical protein M1831_005227 [Alyxoria varia]|nr:MAG: hypothetical protein M1831_005227 [Alyxoria varia]
MSALMNAAIAAVALLGSSIVLAAPAANQEIQESPLIGPSAFPLRTILEFAVLQPEGNDYLVSNYTQTIPPRECSPLYITRGNEPEPVPHVRFETTNETSADGCTQVELRVKGFGLSIGPDGKIEIKSGLEDPCDFYVKGNTLSHPQAPNGFFYCGDPANPDPSNNYIGVQNSMNTYASTDSGTGNCHQAVFVAQTAAV